LLDKYLDSPAGQNDSEARAEQLQARYFALPPKKRPNYGCLSVAAPFRAPWTQLLADWRSMQTGDNAQLPQVEVQLSQAAEEAQQLPQAMAVVQLSPATEEVQLSQTAEEVQLPQAMEEGLLSQAIEGVSLVQASENVHPSEAGKKLQLSHPADIGQGASSIFPVVLRCESQLTSIFGTPQTNTQKEESCLVPVRIRIQGRGTLGPNSMLCLPLPSDLQELAGKLLLLFKLI
jgi:POPLD (NUC188) domain